MAAQVSSVFLYVDDVLKSLEFYNEIVGAEISQVHAEHEGRPSPWRSFGSAPSA